jgi:hypothetical protein
MRHVIRTAAEELRQIAKQVGEAHGEASPLAPSDSPLRVALLAARDALAAFGKQAGWVPQQHGYPATMTEAEMQLARAVADINTILVQTLNPPKETP